MDVKARGGNEISDATYSDAGGTGGNWRRGIRTDGRKELTTRGEGGIKNENDGT